MITPGSYILLTLLVRVLAGSGPILVEAPAYDRVNSLLRQEGARVAVIPHNGHGVGLAALERQLAAGDTPAFLYVMPTVHNPTGTTMPPPDRERLADLAVRHGLLLVEDDPYGQLRFGGEPAASLHSLLEARGAGHLAVFASSFSKTVAPGLRVGYGVLPEQLAGPAPRPRWRRTCPRRCGRRPWSTSSWRPGSCPGTWPGSGPCSASGATR